MKEIFELLKQVLNREFIRAVLSNPRTKDGVVKAKVRPLEKNGDFMFQVEKFTKTQAFHENINCKDAAEILAGHMENFRQMQILLDELSSTSMPYTCPHGRPTILKFSSEELAKMFKRT